jgi:hypothetical protein
MCILPPCHFQQDESPLAKVTRAISKIIAEQIHDLMPQMVLDFCVDWYHGLVLPCCIFLPPLTFCSRFFNSVHPTSRASTSAPVSFRLEPMVEDWELQRNSHFVKTESLCNVCPCVPCSRVIWICACSNMVYFVYLFSPYNNAQLWT